MSFIRRWYWLGLALLAGSLLVWAQSNVSGGNSLVSPTIIGIINSYNGVTTAGNGVSAIVAAVNLPGNTALVATTPLLTGSATTAGEYAVCWYHVTSQVATTSGSSQLTLTWNDGSAAQTFTNTTLTNVLGNMQQGCTVTRVPASQNISYATSYASVGATPYKYDIYVTLERKQ